MAFESKGIGNDKYTGFSYESKPIVITKHRGRPFQVLDHHNKNFVSEDKRIEVATLYAALRNYEEVSRLTGISAQRIKRMKDEAWFHNIVNRVIKDKNDELDRKLTEVISGCADLIKERLLEGDTKVNYKTGQLFKVPVDSRALALVMGIIFDKRQLIRGEATSRTENISFENRLKELRETFVTFSKQVEIEGEYTDVTLQPESPQREEVIQEASSPILIKNDSQDGEGIQGGIQEGQEPLQALPEQTSGQ